jgi:hypothetical protein
MKNLFRAFALVGLLAGFSSTTVLAGTGSSAIVAATAATPSAPGLYIVAHALPAEADSPVADIAVASEASLQLVTITAIKDFCRAVITDTDGQILRSRKVDGELEVDFYTMPSGTYYLAILDATGAPQIKQTLVKR